MTLDEVKAEYGRLCGERDAAEQKAAPERIAYEKAMQPVYALMDQIESLLGENDTHVISSCEACGEPILDGEKYSASDCIYLCEACAPTWREMLEHPEGFENTETGEQMTAAEAKAFCDGHIARGGSLDDKMVS